MAFRGKRTCRILKVEMLITMEEASEVLTGEVLVVSY